MAHTITVRMLTIAGALALSSSLLVAQNPLAGKWTLNVDSPQGATTATLVVAVEGENATGTIGSDMGESKFAGTVKDGKLTFSFDIAGPQGPLSITTTATATGDAISGEMDYGMGVAPFTGKRAEQ